MSMGIIYLTCASLSFFLMWLVRVSIVAKYARASTLHQYLEEATWSELIVIVLLALVPGLNIVITGILFAFVVFAIALSLVTNQFNKPLRRKEQ